MQKTRDSSIAKLKDQSLFKEFAYIDGKWVSGHNEETFDVYNPADNAWIGSVASINGEQSAQAIKAAQQAFIKWSSILPQERSAILRRWFTLLEDNKEDLALLMTIEQGKSISESRGEIDYAASFLEFYAEEAKRPNIEGITSHLQNAEMEVWREPLGVVGLITPWNFPCAMITRKAAAAMAAGCSVLVHPSHETPFSALALAELAERAGVPKGAFNVLTGYAATIVKPWMDSTNVRGISFTGSTEVGKLLYQQSANTIKKIVLELGGHAPFLVFDDADLDWAVESAISAKFATSGQDCLAANRIYVQRGVYNEFCEKFTRATEKLSVGFGVDDAVIGPLMNKSSIAKQIEHIEDAKAQGAKLLTGGNKHPAGELFMEPTVFCDVPESAKLFTQETFGPIAGIAPFDTEEEVIKKANNTEYGLVAYVHTKNAHKIYSLTHALKYGMVAVNRTKITGAPIPFGGTKQSGIGREGARLGMEEFTEIKYVCRNYTYNLLEK